MMQWIDDHLSKDWFKTALDYHNRGQDNVFTFGIRALKESYNDFYDNNLHKVEPYHVLYEPNPYRYQYDLFMHLWFNFFKILKREIKILRKDGKDELADELYDTQKLYGISRTDCWFAGAELIWPTTIKSDGSRYGKMIRDPWSEKRIEALSDEYVKYVAGFGGGGQGKTTVFSAFNITMFDRFLFTEKGSRCMISTTSEVKLKSVAWPYITGMYRAIDKGVSLYAGRGQIKGDYTIMRPNTKDTAGVFKGILLGATINQNTIMDKLTGTHGHPYVGYILDEATSTPNAPIDAANNFTLSAGDSRVMLAGNFGEDGDTLEINIRPRPGWDSVSEETGSWRTTTTTGQEIIVLHFNNNLSPGVTDPDGAGVMFPHMPSLKKLNELYPIEKRVLTNLGYRRFWIGFRALELDTNIVITQDLVRQTGADQELILINAVPLLSFDSAQAEIDRNPALIGAEGLDPTTKERIWGPKKIQMLKKSTESIKYLRESTLELSKILQAERVQSGNAICDWTGRPGQAEMLADGGFQMQRLLYNKGLPDGKTIDTIERRVLPPIRLDIIPDFKDPSKLPAGVPPVYYAHTVAETCIDFAAWLLRAYIQAGRVRGLTANFLKENCTHDPSQEFFSRKCYEKSSLRYGNRFKISPKEEFRKQMGFSPDIFDTLCQMAYLCYVYRGIPLTPIGSSAILAARNAKQQEAFTDIWQITERLDETEVKKPVSIFTDENLAQDLGIQIQDWSQSARDEDYWQHL